MLQHLAHLRETNRHKMMKIDLSRLDDSKETKWNARFIFRRCLENRKLLSEFVEVILSMENHAELQKKNSTNGSREVDVRGRKRKRKRQSF